MIKTLSTGEQIEITAHDRGTWIQIESSIGERGSLLMFPKPKQQNGVTLVAHAGSLGLTANDVATLKAEASEDARRKAAENSKPVNVARRRVSGLFDAAERRLDYPGEYYPLLRDAQRALADWRKEYPEAADEERRAALRAKAAHREQLALGALTYDADGSLSAEMQRERHDAWKAEAAELRREADA